MSNIKNRFKIILYSLLHIVVHIHVRDRLYARKRILHRGYEIYSKSFIHDLIGDTTRVTYINAHVKYIESYEKLERYIDKKHKGKIRL